MGSYLQSTWTKVGIGLLVVGAGPLLFIILAAAVGLWPDPNPNPVGPGLLFFVTFWPAVICIVIGVVRVRRADRNAS
jgi:hypothetical protein